MLYRYNIIIIGPIHNSIITTINIIMVIIKIIITLFYSGLNGASERT